MAVIVYNERRTKWSSQLSASYIQLSLRIKRVSTPGATIAGLTALHVFSLALLSDRLSHAGIKLLA